MATNPSSSRRNCILALAMLALAGCGKKNETRSRGDDDDDEPKKKPSSSAASSGDASAAVLKGFVVFESKPGRYKVLVPKTPEVDSKPMTVEGKSYKAEWMHSSADGKAAYMCQWNEAVPKATAADFLESYSKSLIEGVGASVVEMKPTKVGAIAALDTKATHTKMGSVFMRLFVVDGSIYRLMTAAVPEREAMAYFASFERS